MVGVHVLGDSVATRWVYQTIDYANGDISLKHYKNSLSNLRDYNEAKIILSQNERAMNVESCLKDPKAYYTRDKPLPEVTEARKLYNDFWEQDDIPKNK